MKDIIDIACIAYLKSSDPEKNWNMISKQARNVRRYHMKAALEAIALHKLEPEFKRTYIENGFLKLKKRGKK